MKFTKEQLNFLDLYAMCIDMKNVLNDKVQVKSNGTEVVFTQISDEATLIKSFPSTEEINVIFPTVPFNQLIKSLPDKAELEISEKGVIAGNSKYEFEKVNYELPSTDLFYNKTKSRVFTNSFTLKDVKRMNVVKFCMGIDDLGTIALMDSHFVASNKYDVTGAVKTNNDFTDTFYFFKNAISILLKYEAEELTVNIEDNEYYHAQINDVDIFIPFKDSGLINIFDEEIKTLYEHPYTVNMNRASVKEALSRLKIFTSDVEGRIYVTFSENHVVLEAKESGYAIEKIPAVYASELEGHSIIISINSFITVLNTIAGDNVVLNVLNDADANVFKISDEKGEIFFIQSLYVQ